MSRLALLFLLLAAPMVPTRAWAADCTVPPVLQLRPIDAAPVIEHKVSPAAIEQLSGAPPPHALMAMGYAVDNQIGIAPADAASCAAGVTVIIRFGIVRRDLFLVSAASDNPCIRQALLAHEAAHSRIIAAGAARFLEQQRVPLTAALDGLWATAPEPARLEAGLFGVLRRLAAEFGAEMRGPLRKAGDNPAALADLAGACHGAVGDLDRAIRAHGAVL
jgi:hypothetical protein